MSHKLIQSYETANGVFSVGDPIVCYFPLYDNKEVVFKIVEIREYSQIGVYFIISQDGSHLYEILPENIDAQRKLDWTYRIRRNPSLHPATIASGTL